LLVALNPAVKIIINKSIAAKNISHLINAPKKPKTTRKGFRFGPSMNLS